MFLITLPPDASVYCLLTPVELTADIDQVVAQCQREGLEPRSGAVFAFFNEEATVLGLLSYDGSGYQCCWKRRSRGTFVDWPTVTQDKTPFTVRADAILALLAEP